MLGELAFSLSIYAHTPIRQAMDVPVSLAMQFFDSKSFEGWKRTKESEGKVAVAVVSRLNEVIRAIGVLSKGLSK